MEHFRSVLEDAILLLAAVCECLGQFRARQASYFDGRAWRSVALLVPFVNPRVSKGVDFIRYTSK